MGKLKIGDNVYNRYLKITGTIVKIDNYRATIRIHKNQYLKGWSASCDINIVRSKKSKSKFWYMSPDELRKIK